MQTAGMKIPEAFLHHCWRWQLWHRPLETTDGREIKVRSPGTPNVHEGPDFLDADIEIGGIRWRGHVEVDVRPADWQRHGHHRHVHYQNVILHVVWNASEQAGHTLPLLPIKDYVRKDVMEKWDQLLHTSHIPMCGPLLDESHRPVIQSTLERAGLNRLHGQAQRILDWLAQGGHHWEGTAYRWMVRYMGSGPNIDAFEALALHLPIHILWKHRDQLDQVEALLFGMAGLLPDVPSDNYSRMLQREFNFLQHKYALRRPMLQWKMARLRPANFPTVRIAQLAAFIHHHGDFLRPLLSADSLQSIARLVHVPLSHYWQRHYYWGRPYLKKAPGLGRQWQTMLLINVAAPLQYAYGLHQQLPQLRKQAIKLWDRLPAEQHHIARRYVSAGFSTHSALHSQGVLYMFRRYCSPRKCMECPIGITLLKGVAP